MLQRIISGLGPQRLTAIAAAGFLLLGAALVTLAGMVIRPPRVAEVTVANANHPGATLPVSTVTVGSIPPRTAPAPGVVPPTVDTIRVTPTGEAVLSGTAAPGSRVEILEGNAKVGSATANAGGGFALGLDKALAPGVHQLAVRSTSKDGATQLLSDARWSVTVPAASTKVGPVPDVGPQVQAVVAPTATVAPSPSPVAAGALGTSPGAAGANAKASAVATAPNGTRTITVQPGDNLWTIAEAALGDGSAWETLYRANRKVIRNPRQLTPGQVLVVPGTGK